MTSDIVSLRLLKDSLSKIDGTGLRFMLPFNSGGAASLTTTAEGAPATGMALGYALTETILSFSADESIDLSEIPQNQLSFNAPFSCTVDSIYLTCSPISDMTIEAESNLRIGVAIYKASSASSLYQPLSAAEALVENLSGSLTAGQLFSANKAVIGAEIHAGDRLMIMSLMRSSGPSSQSHLFTFSGGVSFLAAGGSVTPSDPLTANTASLQNTGASSLSITLLSAQYIPFPDTLYLPASGFSKSADHTTITVLKPGVYHILYRVSATAEVGMSFDVLIGDEIAPQLHRTSLAAVGDVQCSAVLSLPANAAIRVQVSGILGTLALANGVGAELTIMQIA